MTVSWPGVFQQNDFQLLEGVREFDILESKVIGRARLLPSQVLVPKIRLSRSFALPIPGHS